MTRQALPVHARDVDAAWPQVLGFIERALAESDGSFAAEDVKARCKSGEALLWVGIGPHAIEMVMVTEILIKPRCKVMRVWLMAGSGAPEWIAARSDAVEEWAEKSGCAWLEMVGRKGWLRRLPGWSHTHVVMRKEVGHGRR